MHYRKIVQIDAEGRCYHEFEAYSKETVALGTSHMDVTDRTDGPFLGKIYDSTTDTFSDPPPPEEDGESQEN